MAPVGTDGERKKREREIEEEGEDTFCRKMDVPF